jgi:hypothetical protein
VKTLYEEENQDQSDVQLRDGKKYEIVTGHLTGRRRRRRRRGERQQNRSMYSGTVTAGLPVPGGITGPLFTAWRAERCAGYIFWKWGIGRSKEQTLMLLSNSKRIIIEVKFSTLKKRKRQIRRSGRDDAQIPQRKIQRKQTSGHES